MRTRGLGLIGILFCLSSSRPTCVAGIITSANIDPAHLASVLMSPTGFPVVDASLSVNSTVTWINDGVHPLNTNASQPGFQSGTYAATGYNAYGLSGSGVVLSSGDVRDFGSGPNVTVSFTKGYRVAATAPQSALLIPITERNFNWDVAELDITFSATGGPIAFDVVFGSDEYPSYQNTSYTDGFGLYLNGLNIALVAGLPITIAHPGFASVSETELNGVLVFDGSPRIRVVGTTLSGTNYLSFIIADAQDFQLDSTVYIQGASVPEASTLSLLALGSLGAVLTLLRNKKASFAESVGQRRLSETSEGSASDA